VCLCLCVCVRKKAKMRKRGERGESEMGLVKRIMKIVKVIFNNDWKDDEGTLFFYRETAMPLFALIISTNWAKQLSESCGPGLASG